MDWLLIITSLSPVFHTGKVKPVGGGSRSHGLQLVEHSSIFDPQMSFSAGFFFKVLGWATPGMDWVQYSIITTGVIIPEPNKKILEICLAICSKKRYMSIFATHEYNIID